MNERYELIHDTPHEGNAQSRSPASRGRARAPDVRPHLFDTAAEYARPRSEGLGVRRPTAAPPSHWFSRRSRGITWPASAARSRTATGSRTRRSPARPGLELDSKGQAAPMPANL